MSETGKRLLVAVVVLMTATGCTFFKRKAYEGFWGRDGWQQPERVIKELHLSPGERVADLGSGGGYFTFRLADAVGEGGRVYAVDVDTGLLEYLDEKSESDGYPNVETVLADYDDPKIPGDAIGMIFTSNTYHHLENRSSYFRHARRYLRANGRVAIVELQKKDGGIMSWLMGDHSTDPDVIESEMAAAGYELEMRHEFLENQSFQIFRLRP